MLRGIHIGYWGMRLKRMIDQEETEPKCAYDAARSWKSSAVRKSIYARMLFLEERKAG